MNWIECERKDNLICVGQPNYFVFIRYIAGTDETKTKIPPSIVHIPSTNPRSEITARQISKLSDEVYSTFYFRRDDKNEVMNDN
jgi:hypothetical protein